MGIEIHITVPHNVVDVSFNNIVNTFRPLGEVFGEISGYYALHGYEHSSRAWARIDTEYYGDSYRHKPIAFDAPAGFGFYFGPHVLSIHHHTRLGSFCCEPEVRQLLRRFTYRVLKLMSGERAIYSPDDYGIFDLVFDGQTFAEINANLLRSGSPACSFAELARQSGPDRHNYTFYIDGFEDICETTNTP